MPIWSIKFKQDANTETRPTLDPPLTHHRTVNIPEGSLLTIQNLSLRFVFFPVDPTKSKKTQSCKTLILNKEQETSASHVKTDNERSPCAHQSCNLSASRANSFPFLPLHSYVTDICCITLSISHGSWFWALRLFHSSLFLFCSYSPQNWGLRHEKGTADSVMIETDWWSKIRAGLTCVCSPRPSDEALQLVFEERETASINEDHSKSNIHANTSRH